jgi:hypothetical protein
LEKPLDPRKCFGIIMEETPPGLEKTAPTALNGSDQGSLAFWACSGQIHS